MEYSASSVSGQEWRQSVDLAPLQQSYEYGEVCRKLGRTVLRLKVSSGDSEVKGQFVLRPIFGANRIALLSRGPIWSQSGTGVENALNAFANTLPVAWFGAILATPNEDFITDSLPLMTGATVAEIPLFRDAARQRSLMKSKWRNRLVRAEGGYLSLSIEPPIPSLLLDLLARDAAQQKLRRYRSLPPRFLQFWAELFPKNTHIIVSRTQGEIDAAMVFLRHGRSATYFLGWRSGDHHGSVHNLMLWRAMRFLAGVGVESLDLGMLDTVNAPGLARFKLGTGAQARRLGNTILLRKVHM